MADNRQLDAVVNFYETHPINEQQIIEKLEHDGYDPANVTESVLQNYDQDHYGGTAANDVLASLAGIDHENLVLDVCCGMGGPSRYLAHKYGCRVTGLDFTKSRIVGARKLTAMTGLSDRVEFEHGNALDIPFSDESYDVLISQEAFCHVPQKERLMSECVRVIKPGGLMAFTDILTTDLTSDGTKKRLQREMTFQELGSAESYRRMLAQEGCDVLEVQDLSDEWRDILTDRLKMYRSLKDQTVKKLGEDHFKKWDDAYSFFVGLYETGELGGGRFLARRVSGK